MLGRDQGLYTVIHEIPSWLTVPSNTNVFHQVDNMHDICIPYNFEVKEEKQNPRTSLSTYCLASSLLKRKNGLAVIPGLCIECVALIFISNIIYTNCCTKFMTFFWWFTLCQNCCELPSGVSLPTVGVLSGCVA